MSETKRDVGKLSLSITKYDEDGEPFQECYYNQIFLGCLYSTVGENGDSTGLFKKVETEDWHDIIDYMEE